MPLLSIISKDLFRTVVKSGLVNAAKVRGKRIVLREADTVKLFARYSLLRTRLRRLFAQLGRLTYPYIEQNEDICITSDLQRIIEKTDALFHEMEIVRTEIRRRKEMKQNRSA